MHFDFGQIIILIDRKNLQNLTKQIKFIQVVPKKPLGKTRLYFPKFFVYTHPLKKKLAFLVI